VVSDALLAHELLVMTDWYTDELYALPHSQAVPVRFPISRLVLDPERFLDDTKEPMASRGMGVIYTRTADGIRLREPPSPSERGELIARYYRPHHAALSAALNAALKDHGACLLVDCHSFASRPLKCDLDQAYDRPDVCLGTDRVHTPTWLIDAARDLFVEAGLGVAIDRPFSGTIVPAGHSDRPGSIYAMMVELNRRLYMNEQTGDRLSDFPRIARIVQDVLLTLVHETQSRLTSR
jgi:N-formylglutamate amidohydrolase